MSKDPRSEQPAASTSSDASGVIQSVSREARKFPPPAAFKARALLSDAAEYERLYERSIEEPEAFWGEMARKELAWMQAVHQGARLEAPLGAVVRGRRAEPVGELPRPAPGDRAATRSRCCGRASRAKSARITYAELHARGLPLRQRAQGPGPGRRRPRRDLHADDPRGGGRDAGLRAHRRAAHGGLRRLLGRGAARPHQRLRRQGRASPRTAATAAAR